MEYLKPVIEKLGFEPEALTKLESGELTADDFVSGYLQKIEQPIIERIKTTVEKEKGSELQRGAYARAEKLLIETFGVDASKYENIDNQKRLDTIIKDLKAQKEQSVENLKKEYSSADAKKVQQLTEQLEMLNGALTEKEKAIQEALAQGEAKLSEYKRTQLLNSKRDSLIEGVKNSILTPKQMRNIFDADVAELGYTFEVSEDGKIWVNKNGQRIPNPNKPTENLTYEMLFEQIAAQNQFVRSSNGQEPIIKTIDPKDAVNNSVLKKRLQHLKENEHI